MSSVRRLHDDVDRIDTAADGEAPTDVQLERLARQHEHVDWDLVKGLSTSGVAAWVERLSNAEVLIPGGEHEH